MGVKVRLLSRALSANHDVFSAFFVPFPENCEFKLALSMITQNTSLDEILQINPNLGFVLHRYDISLDVHVKSLKQACNDAEINPGFFVRLLNNCYLQKNVDMSVFLGFGFSEIIDFLKRTHRFYLNKRLNEIDQTINNLAVNYPECEPMFDYLIFFFQRYKKGLATHLNIEEKVLFPYIVLLERASFSPTAKKEAELASKEISIQGFLDNHDDSTEKELSSLQNYLEKTYSEFKILPEFRVLMTQLSSFEEDLTVHAMIEDYVLLPKALQLEKEAFKN